MAVMYKLSSGVVLIFVSLVTMKRLRILDNQYFIQFLTEIEIIFLTEF